MHGVSYVRIWLLMICATSCFFVIVNCLNQIATQSQIPIVFIHIQSSH